MALQVGAVSVGTSDTADSICCRYIEKTSSYTSLCEKSSQEVLLFLSAVCDTTPPPSSRVQMRKIAATIHEQQLQRSDKAGVVGLHDAIEQKAVPGLG